MRTIHLGMRVVCSHKTWAHFLSLARSKLRLCMAKHRTGYFSNLACDWLSIAYSRQATENGPWSCYLHWHYQYHGITDIQIYFSNIC